MTVELAHEIHANREIPSYLKQGSIDLKPLGAKVDNETLYIHQVYNSKK